MYIEPMTPEQVSHNASLLVQAVRSIGINYDLQVRLNYYDKFNTVFYNVDE